MIKSKVNSLFALYLESTGVVGVKPAEVSPQSALEAIMAPWYPVLVSSVA